MSASTLYTRQLVTQYLQALAARDIPALLACLAESIDWDVPGARHLAPWLGPRRHRAEVRAFFELLFAHTVPVAAQLESLLVDGPVAIVTGTFTTTMLQTNRPYSSWFCIHFTVEQGQIVRYRLLEDTWALVQALS